jgi:hypothetical protein
MSNNLFTVINQRLRFIREADKWVKLYFNVDLKKKTRDKRENRTVTKIASKRALFKNI